MRTEEAMVDNGKPEDILSSSVSTISSVPERGTVRNDYLQAIVDGFPLAVSVFAYGLAYGALAHTTNHLSLVQTLAMSIFVFAGASQFTVLALLHQGAAFGTIVSSALLLNARQILYGLNLGPYLRRLRPRVLAGLAHGLTDESYSVSIVATQKRELSALYFAGAGSAVFFPWLISSAAGFLLGGLIGDPQKFGLDYAYIGAFLGLLMAQLKTRRQVFGALLAATVATLAAHWYGTSGAVLAGALVSFAYGWMQRVEGEKQGLEQNQGKGQGIGHGEEESRKEEKWRKEEKPLSEVEL